MFAIKKVCLAAVFTLVAGAASAAVVSVNVLSSSFVKPPNAGGDAGVTAVIGTPSGGVVGGNEVNDGILYAFNEQQNVTLASDLAIDVIAGTIAAGRNIASHYVMFDPARETVVSAEVTFNRKILGLIIYSPTLATSNFLGADGITYLAKVKSGLEGLDTITFSGDLTSFTWRSANPGDHIRVITAAVPLPAGGLLLIGALGGLMLMRRRKA